MNFIYYLMAAFVFAVFVHLVADKKARDVHPVTDVLMRYFVFMFFGVSAVIAAAGHIFLADKIAAYIGWPAGNPFQYEVGIANFAFGVLGVISLGVGGGFRIAAGLGSSIFGLGAGIGHIREIMNAGNYHPGNAGMPLYLDFILPAVFFLLLIVYYFSGRGLRKE